MLFFSPKSLFLIKIPSFFEENPKKSYKIHHFRHPNHPNRLSTNKCKKRA